MGTNDQQEQATFCVSNDSYYVLYTLLPFVISAQVDSY